MWVSIPPTTLQSQSTGKQQCWPSPCTRSHPDYALHGNQTNWVNQEEGFRDGGEVAPELNTKKDSWNDASNILFFSQMIAMWTFALYCYTAYVYFMPTLYVLYFI